MHILDSSNGEPVINAVTPTGGRYSCRSGLSFYTGNSSGEGIFSTYAVLDESTSTSRIVIIDHPTGEARTSEPINGIISGTPQIGSRGEYIYLTRNIATRKGIVDGHFTLVDVLNMRVVFTHPSSAYLEGNVTGPYAPLALVHHPTLGNFGEGEGDLNTNDIAAWAQSNGEGRELKGISLAFQFPVDMIPGNFTSIQPYLLKVNGWSTITKPILSRNGLNIYFTGSKASLRGWNSRFGRRASWKAEQFNKDSSDARMPLISAPTLSNDEMSMFVSSASGYLYSVETTSGLTQWIKETDSAIQVEARISPDGKILYSVERANGKITAHNSVTGDSLWSVYCGTYDQFNPFCEYGVSAEFSLSPGGCFLYYADVFGRVRAIELGFHQETAMPVTIPVADQNTSKPAEINATLSPTSTPTIDLSMEPTIMTGEPTVRPTLSPTPNLVWSVDESSAAVSISSNSIFIYVLVLHLGCAFY